MSFHQIERRARARGVATHDHRNEVQAAIDAFNGDVSQTHKDNPDSRHHYHARFPIMAEDCDYEIVGFSGISAQWVAADERQKQIESVYEWAWQTAIPGETSTETMKRGIERALAVANALGGAA